MYKSAQNKYETLGMLTALSCFLVLKGQNGFTYAHNIKEFDKTEIQPKVASPVGWIPSALPEENTGFSYTIIPNGEVKLSLSDNPGEIPNHVDMVKRLSELFGLDKEIIEFLFYGAEIELNQNGNSRVIGSSEEDGNVEENMKLKIGEGVNATLEEFLENLELIISLISLDIIQVNTVTKSKVIELKPSLEDIPA